MTRVRTALPLIILLSLWVVSAKFVAPLAVSSWAEFRLPEVPAAERLGSSGPCDFTMFWAAGRMAASGMAADTYRPDRLRAWQLAHMQPGLPELYWVYPPPALLLTLIFQIPAFFPAFFVWSFCLTGLAAALLIWAAIPWPVIAASLLSPAALLSFDLGQLGMITAALFIAGLRRFETQPAGAGGVLSLLIVKPHIGLLAAVVLLSRASWRAIAAAAGAGFALAGLTTALFGWRVWGSFAGSGLPFSRMLLTAPFPSTPGLMGSSYEFYGSSVIWMLRSFGFGTGLSSAAQTVVSIAAIFICWRAWRDDRAEAVARIALTACLAVLMLPYGFVYDLCGCSIALAALAWRERRLLLTDVVLWTWPVSSFIISRHLHLELTPVAVGFGAWRAWRAMHADEIVGTEREAGWMDR